MRGVFFLVLFTAVLSSTAAQASNSLYKMIATAASRHGIPAALALKVVQIESGFDCNAQGSAGELGPLQIKPATARLIGYRGTESALRSCGAGLEWGMKHLALAVRAGGVWKHNQGLWAKSKSTQGAAYEQKVMNAKLKNIEAADEGLGMKTAAARGGRPSL